MKTFLALVVVAAAAGCVTGYLTTARGYAWPAENFGYFSKGSDLQPQALPAHLQSLQPGGLPKVEVVGGEDFDFGSMSRDAKGEHDFVIQNVGDTALDLKVVGTTCKCTLGELEDASLAPGESTVVHMTWTAKTDSNHFQQTATISTTDPYNGELQLRIIGSVVDPLSVSPSSWNAGEMSSATPIDMECLIYSRMEFDVRLKDTRWYKEIPGVAVDLDVKPVPVPSDIVVRQADTRQAFLANLKVSPGLEPGLFSYTAVIEFEPVEQRSLTDDELAGLKTVIKLEGRVVSDLSLSGGSRLSGRDDGRYVYTIPPVKVGAGASENLLVFVRGPHRDEMKPIVGEIDPQSVLEAELGEPNRKENLVIYPLKLSVREDAPVMERNGNRKDDYGTITIQSDNDQVAPLLLRVKFDVHDGR